MNNRNIAIMAITAIAFVALATSVGFALGSADSDFSDTEPQPPLDLIGWCPDSWYNGACFLTQSGCWTCYSCCGSLCGNPYLIC